MSSYHEVLGECAEKLGKAFREVADQALELWDRLKEQLVDIEPEYIEIPILNWHVPTKIILKNQVLDRKPRMAVARSSC